MLRSLAQMRKLFSLEGQGKVKKGTAMEFVHSTPHLDQLPERVKPPRRRRKKK